MKLLKDRAQNFCDPKFFGPNIVFCVRLSPHTNRIWTFLVEYTPLLNLECGTPNQVFFVILLYCFE